MDEAPTIAWSRWSLTLVERLVVASYALPGALAGVLCGVLLPLSADAVALDEPVSPAVELAVEVPKLPGRGVAGRVPVVETVPAPIVLDPIVIRARANAAYGPRVQPRVAALAGSCFVERDNGGRAVVDVRVSGGTIVQATPVVDGTGAGVAACIAAAVVGETVPVPPGGRSTVTRLRFR